MFTGFETENVPNIKIWEFSYPSASSSTLQQIVGLTDDCAPIQYFRTGQSSNLIAIYLPTAPVEGKTITIINNKFGSNAQTIYVYAPDAATNTTLFRIAQGGSETFVFSKQLFGYGPNSGYIRSGWVTLKTSPVTSANYYSVVAGGFGNQASNTYSFVGGGNANIASGSTAVVAGGSSNSASGVVASVVGGTGNGATGNWSFVGGGQTNSANSDASVIAGGYYGITRSIIGMAVSPAAVTPIASVQGVTQSGLLLLGVETTGATDTILRSNTSVAGTTNQIILPNNSAYYVRGSVIANVTGGGNTSAWTFEGVIKRGANAAATTLIQSVVNLVGQDSGAAAWVVAIAADTTNGGLKVTVTGAASTTIRWVCKIETTEVTF